MSPGSGEGGASSAPERVISLERGLRGIAVATGAKVRDQAQQGQARHASEHRPSGPSPGHASAQSCSGASRAGGGEA